MLKTCSTAGKNRSWYSRVLCKFLVDGHSGLRWKMRNNVLLGGRKFFVVVQFSRGLCRFLVNGQTSRDHGKLYLNLSSQLFNPKKGINNRTTTSTNIYSE